ncbi:MAG: site-specific DNA-methyltransferase [Campylobacter sp.]|nr:site-specific DNA-methyltransferase [Campylobacter sp.]MCI7446787.1 site-specific DNA-methyltransferase [Campylobacter sp.]
MNKSFINQVFYKSSQNMSELPDFSVDLIITSPPYFNIKDYSKDGYQNISHSQNKACDLGSIDSFDEYIKGLLEVWKECFRVLRPNGKLCINVPLMPMLKKNLTTHHNRHIFDLQSEIQNSILKNTKFFLMDLYIWNRVNTTKSLMFGSYPYPNNFYAQNTSEFITIFVKDGKPKFVDKTIKEESKLTQTEWVEFTKQIWNIPIPNKSDIAFGKHAAIMPAEIPYRLIKMYSFKNDIILDPFAGSGTTLWMAKNLRRNFVGYELYENYKNLINERLNALFN